MELPKRNKNRLNEFDYSTPNAYFVTVCTHELRNLFWETVGAVIGRPWDAPLTEVGKIVWQSIEDIPKHYPAVTVDHFAVMPNHIHILLQIHSDSNGRPMTAPTVAMVVNQTKGAVTKKAGFTVWQKGFYDHVVRGESDYREIWEYIEGNPGKWEEDRFCENREMGL